MQEKKEKNDKISNVLPGRQWTLYRLIDKLEGNFIFLAIPYSAKVCYLNNSQCTCGQFVFWPADGPGYCHPSYPFLLCYLKINLALLAQKTKYDNKCNWYYWWIDDLPVMLSPEAVQSGALLDVLPVVAFGARCRARLTSRNLNISLP